VEFSLGVISLLGVPLPPRKESLAYPLWRETPFVLRTNLLRLLPPVEQIVLDLGPVPQIVGEDRVHVCEAECWVTLRHLLGTGSFLEGAGHNIERNARPADTHHPVGVTR